jgi:hypothetical protein
MSKFLNISKDSTLGGNSPSDEVISSQKAIKNYIDNNASGGTSGISIQKITQEDYNALAEKDENTLYIISTKFLIWGSAAWGVGTWGLQDD